MRRNRIEEEAYRRGYRVDRNGVVYNANGLTLKGTEGCEPYLYFAFKHNGMYRQKCFIHRFQAYLKYKENLYDRGMVVRHLNGDTYDNSWGNIAIGTQSENMMDIPEKIRKRRSIIAVMSEKGIMKYCDKTVSEIREYRKSGRTYKEIMKKYNISSKGTLYYILNNRLTKEERNVILF